MMTKIGDLNGLLQLTIIKFSIPVHSDPLENCFIHPFKAHYARQVPLNAILK